jgi:predicted RNA-binding Zn-ribbon protein involved in translation (DUF1610 family)
MHKLPEMKRVWSGSSLLDTTHFMNLLEHAGVACVIKNRELGGGIGDLPVFDCSPEIWVQDDDAERAAAVIRDSLRPAANAASWRCPRCGEDNEPQFAVCWSCSRGDSRQGEPT